MRSLFILVLVIFYSCSPSTYHFTTTVTAVTGDTIRVKPGINFKVHPVPQVNDTVTFTPTRHRGKINAHFVRGHQCTWAGCGYDGLLVLPEPYNPIDSIHFAHPHWSYKKASSKL